MDLEENFLHMPEDESFLRKIDEDLDFAFAVALQTQFAESNENEEKNDLATLSKNTSEAPSKPLSVVDEQWELIDPHPDIHGLFLEFDARFFYGKLQGVEVKWSPRMTLCAGLCSYEGQGGLCSIRLSLPLLKLRPRRDLVETLLHEMIHAYLFVTQNNKDHDSHGPEFLSHMFRINKETGAKITVYHNFHDEVDAYRTHWWKCDGPCQKKHPFYGVVKRAMNRAPGPNDRWWSEHKATCGGTFTKIKEPENYGKKKTVKRKIIDNSVKTSPSDLRRFFPPESKKSSPVKSFESKWTSSKTTFGKKSQPSNIHSVRSIFSSEDNLVPLTCTPQLPRNSFVPFSGHGRKLGSSSNRVNPVSCLLRENSTLPREKGEEQPKDFSNFSDLNRVFKLKMKGNEYKWEMSDSQRCSDTSEDEEDSSQDSGIPVISEDATSPFTTTFSHRNRKVMRFDKKVKELNDCEISDTQGSSGSSEDEENSSQSPWIPVTFEDTTSPFSSRFSRRGNKLIKLGRKRDEPGDFEIPDTRECSDFSKKVEKKSRSPWIPVIFEDSPPPFSSKFVHRGRRINKLGGINEEPSEHEITPAQKCPKLSENVEKLFLKRGIPWIFKNTASPVSPTLGLGDHKVIKLVEKKDESNECEILTVKKCAAFSKITDSSSLLDHQEKKPLTLCPQEKTSTSPENFEVKSDLHASCSQNVMIQENFHNNNFTEVECPVCFLKVKSDDINPHLDKCLYSYI